MEATQKKTIMSISIIEQYLSYEVEYKVVVCRRCKHAVLPREITTHFSGNSHHLTKSRCRELLAAVNGIPSIIKVREDIPVFHRVVDPIKSIETHHDGLRCTYDEAHCRYIYRKVINMRQHVQREHQWTKYRRRGRPIKKTQHRETEET